MKVIVAGYSKTGTKSLNLALTQLGYNVYDYIEHIWYHEKQWKKIIKDGKGSVEDFREMYKDVDAAMDAPIYVFWEEIHKAFPDAKIVLTTRDEDSWHKSWVSQILEFNHYKIVHLALILSRTGARCLAHSQRIARLCWGVTIPGPFRDVSPNEMVSRILYRRHYAYVREKAPKDKLLVYNIKDGWEPLCKFLGNKVPNTEFPRENVGGAALHGFMNKNPAMQRMKKELLFSLFLILFLFLLGGYFFWNFESWNPMRNEL